MDRAGLFDALRRDASSVGVVLDVDGTLAPIATDPDGVQALPGVSEALEALAGKLSFVAILTGRPARTAADILGVTGVWYYGLYGAEVWHAGALTEPDEAETWRSLASRLARDAEAFISSQGLEGCEVEYKGLAVTVHYRNAPDASEAEDKLATWAAAAAPKRGFVSGPGRKVVELRPEGVSKSAAVVRIIDQRSPSVMVLAGDDTQDFEAMRAAGTHLGDQLFAVAVLSDEASSAPEDVAERLGSPDELLELIEGMVEAAG